LSVATNDSDGDSDSNNQTAASGKEFGILLQRVEHAHPSTEAGIEWSS
jgi:hypothetical protein